MKKIGILLLLSMIVIGTACKKDEKIVEPSKEELIKGDWSLESLSSDDGLVLVTLGGETDTTTFSIQSKNENYTLELNENKTFSSSGELTLVQSTVNSDEVEEITESVVDSTSTGTWVIDGDFLSLTSGGKKTNEKIVELSTNRLKLEKIERDTAEVEFFGINVNVYSSNTTIAVYKK